jgi:hypothetical protein
MLAMLVILGMIGTFSKDPVANYNGVFQAYLNYKAKSVRLARLADSLRQDEAIQRKELVFYRNQLRQYRKKFPKSAPSLPPYLPTKKQ